MRKRLMTTALAAVLTVLLAAGGAQAFWKKGGDAVEGSGDPETRTLELSDFDEVDVGGAFEVHVTRGDEYRVTVTIDDNLWDLLEADVEGGALTFDWKESVEPDVDAVIEITAPTLRGLDVHGAAEVTIEDFRGKRFEFGVSGAGDLEMDGEVDELEIAVSGAGEIDTRKLEARHARGTPRCGPPRASTAGSRASGTSAATGTRPSGRPASAAWATSTSTREIDGRGRPAGGRRVPGRDGPTARAGGPFPSGGAVRWSSS